MKMIKTRSREHCNLLEENIFDQVEITEKKYTLVKNGSKLTLYKSFRTTYKFHGKIVTDTFTNSIVFSRIDDTEFSVEASVR